MVMSRDSQALRSRSFFFLFSSRRALGIAFASSFRGAVLTL